MIFFKKKKQEIKQETKQKHDGRQDIIVGKFPRPSVNRIHNSLQTIYKELQKTNLYNEDGSISADYEQTMYILQQINTYIYDRKKSNLTQKDAEVFVDHLTKKMKGLKELVKVVK